MSILYELSYNCHCFSLLKDAPLNIGSFVCVQTNFALLKNAFPYFIDGKMCYAWIKLEIKMCIYRISIEFAVKCI